jgi:hypothetical protein
MATHADCDGIRLRRQAFYVESSRRRNCRDIVSVTILCGNDFDIVHAKLGHETIGQYNAIGQGMDELKKPAKTRFAGFRG